MSDETTNSELNTGEGTNPVAEPVEDRGEWYVVHTYSGYENKVKANIEKIVKNRNLQDLIFDIKVPMEERIEMKNGRKKSVARKVFPGYVLVKMIMNDDTWYIVRNTHGVTGFVGPGAQPVPLDESEVEKLGMDRVEIKIDLKENDNIRVISGPLENFVGIVQEVLPDQQKVRVLVSMFGRETPLELLFSQVQKI